MTTEEGRSIPLDTEKVVGAWVDFWNTYELLKVDELFVTDSSLTYLSSEKEGVMQGIDAVRDHHKGFGFVEGGKESANKLWVEDLQTTQLDAAAVVAGIWFFQRPTGRIQRGPFTSVYALKGNEYRLVHQNFGNYPDRET